MSAFWAPGPAETSIEDTAIKEFIYCILYDLSQVAKSRLKLLLVDLEKSLEIMCQRAVEDGFFRLPATVDAARSWLDAFHASKGRNI